jgi:NADH-quinone oxidoreductase subunit J
MLKIAFIIFAVAAVSGAVSVVVQRQPLYSVLSLVVTLISLAAVYVTLQAQFIAAVQVIVYAGAIMVLFVFVVMLLNVKENVEPDRHRFLRWLAIPVFIVLVGEIIAVVNGLKGSRFDNVITSEQTDLGSTTAIGTGLFSSYMLPFEVTSILILMALVGAVVLARRENK